MPLIPPGASTTQKVCIGTASGLGFGCLFGVSQVLRNRTLMAKPHGAYLLFGLLISTIGLLSYGGWIQHKITGKSPR